MVNKLKGKMPLTEIIGKVKEKALHFCTEFDLILSLHLLYLTPSLTY